MTHTNPLTRKIGIIGGGQLGRMMIEESLRLNFQFHVLDVPGCSCERIADYFLAGNLMNGDDIRTLAGTCDVLTYEIEHVDVETLHQLEAEGKTIIPSPRILQIIQDKGLQKEFLASHGIPTSAFHLVNSPEEWLRVLQTLTDEKVVAKSRRDGYDGKGVAILDRQEVLNDSSLIPFSGPSLIEAFIPCEKELSVMVACDQQGNMVTWPLVEMEFDPIANLVTFLDCPSEVSESIAQQAIQIALNTVGALNGAGVFAIELFLDKSGQIWVNEIAPRPHNSGHHTIEACVTSQFEQLVRILAGLPLGDTSLIRPAVMMNLLGAPGFSGTYRLAGLEEVSAMPGVYIHLYDKKTSKPMRKMGHVTIMASTLHEARQTAHKVAPLLRFEKD